MGTCQCFIEFLDNPSNMFSCSRREVLVCLKVLSDYVPVVSNGFSCNSKN